MSDLNSSRTQQVLRQRGIAIAAGGLALQLLVGLTYLTAGFVGLITLALLVGTAGALIVSYTSLTNKTGLAVMLQVAALIGGLACIFMGAGIMFTFVIQLIGAGVTYFGTKQLAAGLGR